ncbi:glycosyltransferase [Aestuariivivens sediminicola]|uniref:glycosyltransferase n=1 Tax=Aestuariivivens sediminicola TaxID=2913560 RepID=UPI001F583773|nr:glycosyltransferase [Aestuariivivens sediminicola]
MHIGLVLAKTPTYSETFFISKIKGLQANGFKVTMFVQDREPGFNLCPVKVAVKVYKRNIIKQIFVIIFELLKAIPHLNRFLNFFRLEKGAGRSFKRCLKNAYFNAHILSAQVDWLHFGFATLAIGSEHVARAMGTKMAVSFRGFDLDVFPLKHPGCYDLLWHRVDQVHSISAYLLQTAYTQGLPKTVPYQIITPALTFPILEDRPFEKPKAWHIVTVARLHWIKGLQTTLEAMAILKAMEINFRYDIVGDGHDYEALKFAIHQLGLSEQVRLMGKRSHFDTLNLLNQADIYVQFSFSEGFCNAVLEAQALGMLCVVSNAGGLSENIIDGKTGWIVKNRSSKELARTLEYVMQLPGEQKIRVKNQAKERVIKEFNIGKQKTKFMNFYS